MCYNLQLDMKEIFREPVDGGIFKSLKDAKAALQSSKFDFCYVDEFIKYRLRKKKKFKRLKWYVVLENQEFELVGYKTIQV